MSVSNESALAGMSSAYYSYPAASDEECMQVIHRALELGINHLDTSDAYGPHTNEISCLSAYTAEKYSSYWSTLSCHLNVCRPCAEGAAFWPACLVYCARCSRLPSPAPSA